MLGTAPQNTATQSSQYVPDTVAANLIGSTPATMRRWRHEGRGPRYVRIGSTVRYRIADLEAFVAERIVETRDTVAKQDVAQVA